MKQTTKPKWHNLNHQIFSLILLFIAITSCNRQNKISQILPESKSSQKALEAAGQSINFYPWNEPDFMFFKPQQISEYIRRIFQDTKGNLWFGTNGDGVCCFNPSASLSTGGNSLKYFTTKDGLSGNAVRGIVEDKDGNIWFATNGGVSKYDPLAEHRIGAKIFTNFSNKEGLSNIDAWSILIDGVGTIWVSTLGGVFRYNPSATLSTNGTKLSDEQASFVAFSIPFADVKNPESIFTPNFVWCMLEDKKGTIWFGTDGLGIYKYNPSTELGTVRKTLPAGRAGFTTFTEQDGLCNNNVVCIFEDKIGDIWFGSRFGGMSRYEPSAAQRKGEKLFTNFTVKDGLNSNFVYTIFEDSKENIWFSTLGGGVSYYNRKSMINGKACFTNYTAKDGLTNLYVQSIFEDTWRKLWFGTGAGLFRFYAKSFINVTRKSIKEGC